MTKEAQKLSETLIQTAIVKSTQDPQQIDHAIQKAGDLRRYAVALLRREYAVPWRTILLGTFALLYLINPFDFIPDAILFIGWLDDATLIGLWYASMRSDVTAFVGWERDRAPKQGLPEVLAPASIGS